MSAEKCTHWRTSDGRCHDSEEAANLHDVKRELERYVSSNLPSGYCSEVLRRHAQSLRDRLAAYVEADAAFWRSRG